MTKNLQYKLNLHRHVKIWFSKDENVFLNPENQLRLVHFRASNPTDTIYFIYAKSLLTEAAQKQLMKFCELHHIIPIELQEIKKELTTENEHQLMDLLEKELEGAKNNAGGNLASASDIARWLAPVFKKGIYADFDTDIYTKGLPNSISVQAGVVANIGTFKVLTNSNTYYAPSFNNDVFAIPEVDQDHENQHTAKQKQDEDIDIAQKLIIIGYKQANLALLNYVKMFSDVVKILLGEMTANLVIQTTLLPFVVEMSKLGNTPFEIRQKIAEIFSSPYLYAIFQLRVIGDQLPQVLTKFVEECNVTFEEAIKDNKSAEIMEFYLAYLIECLNTVNLQVENNSIKEILEIYTNQGKDEVFKYLMSNAYHNLLVNITIAISGPTVLASLCGKFILTQDECDKLIPYSFEHYNLQNNFKSKNSITLNASLGEFLQQSKTVQNSDDFVSDMSWTEKGQLKINEREKILNNKATFIQDWCRFRFHVKKDAHKLENSAQPEETNNTRKLCFN